MPNRLPDRETDTGSEAAADHEHQHRPERAGHRIDDPEVVEQRLRRRGADYDANQQADVLRQGQPEAAAEAVGHPHDRGPDDDEIDQIQSFALRLRRGSSEYLVMCLGMPRLGRAFEHALRRPIPRVAAQDPPTQADDSSGRYEEGEAHEEPRADPFACEVHRQCAGAG